MKAEGPDINADVNTEVKADVKADTKADVEPDVEADANTGKKARLNARLKARLRARIRARIRARLKAHVKGDTQAQSGVAHASARLLGAYARGLGEPGLSADEVWAVEAHLEGCGECRERLAGAVGGGCRACRGGVGGA